MSAIKLGVMIHCTNAVSAVVFGSFGITPFYAFETLQ